MKPSLLAGFFLSLVLAGCNVENSSDNPSDYESGGEKTLEADLNAVYRGPDHSEIDSLLNLYRNMGRALKSTRYIEKPQLKDSLALDSMRRDAASLKKELQQCEKYMAPWQYNKFRRLNRGIRDFID